MKGIKEGWGEAHFTPRLHGVLHISLHLYGGANPSERNEMRQETATRKDAAQTLNEAGATPSIDARCVAGPRGVAPASWRKELRQRFGPRKQFEEATL